MLQAIRSHAGSWAIKALLLLIVLSFAIWGISDLIQSMIHRKPPVITVGSVKIGEQEFQNHVYQLRQRYYQSKFRPTKAQLHKQAINELITKNLIMLEVQRQSLTIADEVIGQQIRSIKTFKDETGKFNRQHMQNLLSHNGMTEHGFIHEMRSTFLHNQLIEPLTLGLNLPQVYVDTLYQGIEQEKVFAYYKIPFSSVTVIEKPTESALDAFYQQNRDQFTVPEYREITLVVFDANTLAEKVKVDEAKILEMYEQRQDDFFMPEKRQVVEMTFASEAAAKQALEQLKSPQNKGKVSNTYTERNLGWIEQNDLSQKLRPIVFKLNINQISSPIKSSSGWQVYHVKGIQGGGIPPLSEVRSKLEPEARQQATRDYIESIRTRMEDELAGGMTLTEVAQKEGLKAHVITTQQRGLDTHNKEVLTNLESAVRSAILKQAFSLDTGFDSSIQDINGTSFIVQVNGVTAAHVPPLAEITDKVKNVWLNSRRYQLVAQKAQQAATAIKSYSTFEASARTQKANLQTTVAISRASSDKNTKIRQDFPGDLLNRMFSLTNNQAAYGATQDGFVVVVVQKLLPLKEDVKRKGTLRTSLQEMQKGDFESLYQESLKKRYLVHINEKALQDKEEDSTAVDESNN